MESHIMNLPYHQAQYRTIGHKVIRSTSNSISSESSCNQSSPEYKAQHANFHQSHYEEESNEQDWEQNQTVNVKNSNQDTSSDEEGEQIQVQEVQFEEIEGDNSLVEGDDYDVIQIYTVDPDLDLEVSSEEEYDKVIETSESNYAHIDNQQYRSENYEYTKSTDIYQGGLNIDLDTPVVSNVDEYFIKVDNKNILDVKDEPVVRDVDEYFIKNSLEVPRIPYVDDFFIKHKVVEEESTAFRIDTIPYKQDIAIELESKKAEEAVKKVEDNVPAQDQSVDEAINESDLEVLPNIEDLKKFLLEDVTYSKLKNAQKSCSVPHSPMNICMDIDAKTCLSFEDLNLDLSDLAFDNDKDKLDTSINKSDDIPCTLTEEDVNSFLITCNTKLAKNKNEDDLSHLDMEIDRPIESSINTIHEPPIGTPPLVPIKISRNCTSTPIPKPTVLEFCVEKNDLIVPIAVKKDIKNVKAEVDDFVDVESCNDASIPVIEANNLNSLLEQFEATEKLNTKSKRPVLKTEDLKPKTVSKTSLTNGMRLQDAGVQLNKNKMRQILMPSTINATIRRTPSPVHSDHDYCTSKKRNSLPNLKRGQSLLKPEVLSSNNRILNSRHRSCKNKKIVYNLSSDDESEKCNNSNKKKLNNRDDSDSKNKKLHIKQPVKPIAPSTCRKKLSPNHTSVLSDSCKSNNSVINNYAFKAGDTPCSQNSNGSIKLTIKNKCEVILNCDDKDSQKDKHIEKHKSSVCDKHSNIDKCSVKNVRAKSAKDLKGVDSNKFKTAHKKEIVNNKDNAKEISSKGSASLKQPVAVKETSLKENASSKSHDNVKEEPRSKDENFYTALFPNKQDVQLPASLAKIEKRPFDEELQRISEITIKKETEQPQKKKKLNLQEYKMRRVNSNNSSTTVSPESIFPDMTPHLCLEKTFKSAVSQPPNGHNTVKHQVVEPKKLFDPIREASRKILMITKKQKAEALRKRDEDIVMSKIPKVEILELQPLISDAEMMKIVGMKLVRELPVPMVPEKPQAPAEYEEIILVSAGTNTDENIFKQLEVREKRKSSPRPAAAESKSPINFKIKKSDHVLKQNVFDNVKTDKRSPVDDKKHVETKIDKERYKGITAALKSVEKQVDTKISSNSLFASIQDVVLKKAPDESSKIVDRRVKSISPVEKRDMFKYTKTCIVREYDARAEHGEDKVILHLVKNRSKPASFSVIIQTDPYPKFSELPPKPATTVVHKEVPSNRKRNDSDMSMSSEGSPLLPVKEKAQKNERAVAVKEKEMRPEKRSQSKEKRSRSRDRYETKYRRRSRSLSRSRRRRRTPSRSRSRSRGRYRHYRRSDSPYKRKRRSRSPYRRPSPSPSSRRSGGDRRSPSTRRSVCDRRSPSLRRQISDRRSPSPRRPSSPSPVVKRLKLSPHILVEKATVPTVSMTPPLRKSTNSESSYSSSSTSSSSSASTASSSGESLKSSLSGSSYKREEYRTKYRGYSSEDRESNTPVEERRIVFVGKLEKDINKSILRNQFSKFGLVMEVRLHSKEDGTRYGFVTYKHARDAWNAVEAASTFPQYDVGFGGRRAFCRQSYADLDGLEAKYTESAFHGQATVPARRTEDMSFEQMLLEMKKKLSQRKEDKKRYDDKP